MNRLLGASILDNIELLGGLPKELSLLWKFKPDLEALDDSSKTCVELSLCKMSLSSPPSKRL